jgi:hypothetical protein
MFSAFGMEKVGLVGSVLFHTATHHISLGNFPGIMALTLLPLPRILWHWTNISSITLSLPNHYGYVIYIFWNIAEFK